MLHEYIHPLHYSYHSGSYACVKHNFTGIQYHFLDFRFQDFRKSEQDLKIVGDPLSYVATCAHNHTHTYTSIILFHIKDDTKGVWSSPVYLWKCHDAKTIMPKVSKHLVVFYCWPLHSNMVHVKINKCIFVVVTYRQPYNNPCMECLLLCTCNWYLSMWLPITYQQWDMYTHVSIGYNCVNSLPHACTHKRSYMIM